MLGHTLPHRRKDRRLVTANLRWSCRLTVVPALVDRLSTPPSEFANPVVGIPVV